MITSNIRNADRYFRVQNNLGSAFEFLRTLNKNTQPHDFEFEGFKGSIVEIDSNISNDETVLEAHRDYLDIHYVICGEEGFGYADTSTLSPVTVYDHEKDYILLSGNMNRFVLSEGEFCVVFPEDAHLPALYGRSTSLLKKAIIKIRIN